VHGRHSCESRHPASDGLWCQARLRCNRPVSLLRRCEDVTVDCPGRPLFGGQSNRLIRDSSFPLFGTKPRGHTPCRPPGRRSTIPRVPLDRRCGLLSALHPLYRRSGARGEDPKSKGAAPTTLPSSATALKAPQWEWCGTRLRFMAFPQPATTVYHHLATVPFHKNPSIAGSSRKRHPCQEADRGEAR
jgi:hypothetical protein